MYINQNNYAPQFKALRGVHFQNQLQFKPIIQKELLGIFENPNLTSLFKKHDGCIRFMMDKKKDTDIDPWKILLSTSVILCSSLKTERDNLVKSYRLKAEEANAEKTLNEFLKEDGDTFTTEIKLGKITITETPEEHNDTIADNGTIRAAKELVKNINSKTFGDFEEIENTHSKHLKELMDILRTDIEKMIANKLKLKKHDEEEKEAKKFVSKRLKELIG